MGHPGPKFGNGPNTVWESTVSNTELSEFFWGRESGGVQSTGVSQKVRASGGDESQSVPSPEKLLKTRDLELPFFEGSLPSCSPHSAGYTHTFVHPYFPVANKILALTKLRGGELGEFLSGYYLCAKANSPSSSGMSSLFRSSTLVLSARFLKPFLRRNLPPSQKKDFCKKNREEVYWG